MSRRRVKLFITIGLISLLPMSGCATVFSSSDQRITVSSNVEGATVLLDGVEIGKTPLSFELDRDLGNHELQLVDDEHDTRAVRIKKTLNTTALFNCTFILSWGTDLTSGAMMEYSPDAYFVEMTPKKRNALAKRRDLMLFVIGAHAHLLVDIARGDGEYFRAAAALVGVESRHLRVFATALRSRMPEMTRARYPYAIYREVAAAADSIAL